MKTVLKLIAIGFAFSLMPLDADAFQAATSDASPGAVEKKQTAEDDSGAQKASSSVKKGKRKKVNEFNHFLRIKRDSKGRAVSMQTSVTRYEAKNEKGEKVFVDLIGVVHIGEQDYYDQFNELFEKYDALLYELVAPEGTVIPKGGRSEMSLSNPLGMIQQSMQKGLGLEFQLEQIDYTKKNFVHADMTPTEFGESMKDNEESVSRMMFRAMGQSMAMQSRGSGGGDAGLLMAMFSRNPELRLRRVMAEQMKNMEGGMIMFEGKNGSTIIDHRNAKVMEVLRREMAAGKTEIGIFYGAGHLPDMQRRLTSSFQMKRGGQFWMNAWKLTNRKYGEDKKPDGEKKK